MFKRIEGADDAPLIAFTFGGKRIEAPAGISVAAALLLNDIKSFRRTAARGAERGPFCLMGACYDCAVSIDGRSVQACMTPIRAGMKVERVEVDLVKVAP